MDFTTEVLGLAQHLLLRRGDEDKRRLTRPQQVIDAAHAWLESLEQPTHGSKEVRHLDQCGDARGILQTSKQKADGAIYEPHRRPTSREVWPHEPFDHA